MQRMHRMNYYASIALTWSSVFLIVMAVLVDSPALFYMAAAVIFTLLAARLQAYLAVRYLRFERYASPAVKVGEQVTVEVIVWSERKLQRPLVTVQDGLPDRLVVKDLEPALPVAPSYDQPIRTRYRFTPTRRGKYRWAKLTATATDALGLVSASLNYPTDIVELVVYPAPIPVLEELQPMIGWGASDLDSGRKQGAGLEPRGIREYVSGDPLRYVHWRSSARRGRLMVKEFETGSGIFIHFLLQRERGTEVGDEESSTFEAMCGNAMFLASDYAKKSALVLFPQLEDRTRSSEHSEARERSIRDVLTEIQPDRELTLSDELSGHSRSVQPGETIVLFLAVQDESLPGTISGLHDIRVNVLVYDPLEYGFVKGVKPATDPGYIGRLEQAGAHVIVVPRSEKRGLAR
ncbi:MAG: DUF58 domain-containing protein [Fimbriimonadaceae bacterium]|nr:DUF58 domain-containing protein [Fimbriimonadaceae bacterium]